MGWARFVRAVVVMGAAAMMGIWGFKRETGCGEGRGIGAKMNAPLRLYSSVLLV